MPFKKLLVPLDKSQLNHKVLTTALDMAQRFDAEITVLRIRRQAAKLDMEQQDETRVDLNVIEQETRELIATALGKLEPGHSLTADHVGAEVRSGPIVDTIVDAAEELMCDMIIMGTHGRQGIAEFFTGSTTEQVVAKTPASVLVIKPSGFPYLRD